MGSPGEIIINVCGFSLLLASVGAQAAPSCPAPPRASQIAAINLNFTYKQGKTVPFQGMSEEKRRDAELNSEPDAEFFGHLGRDAGFKSVRAFGDPDFNGSVPPAVAKNNLLNKMAAAAANSPYVNFNFSGHSLMTPSGELAMVLPGLDKQKCTKTNAAGKKGPSFEGECMDYYITSSELARRVFKNKKVFGIIDSCHSEAVKSLKREGLAYSFVFASACSEVSFDSMDGGILTKELRARMHPRQLARTDANSDHKVTFGELTRNLPHELSELYEVEDSSGSSKDIYFEKGEASAKRMKLIRETQHPGTCSHFGELLDRVVLKEISQGQDNSSEPKRH